MRVDLLLADRRCYTFEAFAARSVMRHLERLKIEHKLIYLSDGSLQDYLFYIQNLAPSWTLSFANLTPHRKPLCDVLRVPHFFWMEGTFAQALHFLDSVFGNVGVTSQSLCQKLSAPNVFFLPHGVETQETTENKFFDVVLFADLVALPFLEKTWSELFSFEIAAEIKKCVGAAEPLQLKSHFFYVEQYLAAQKTCQTVASFKEVRIDVFGEHAGANWLKQLPRCVHLHTPLPFSEHFEVLKSSKIALVEPESQWYLPAIAANCLPLSQEMSEIKYYLAHPEERAKKVESLREDLSSHTWEKQVDRLIEIMKPQLGFSRGFFGGR